MREGEEGSKEGRKKGKEPVHRCYCCYCCCCYCSCLRGYPLILLPTLHPVTARPVSARTPPSPCPSATTTRDLARATQLPIHRRFLLPRPPIDRSLHSFDAKTEKSIRISTTSNSLPPAPAKTDTRSNQHSSVCLAFFLPILDYIPHLKSLLKNLP